MVTAFGKFCRKLRIDRGQIMLNMAESLISMVRYAPSKKVTRSMRIWSHTSP